MKKWGVIALLILGADMLTKYLTLQHVSQFHPISVFENFLGIDAMIAHVHNKGAAWGVLADKQMHLLIVRLFIAVALLAHLLFFNKLHHRKLPLTLIITGAVGNIVDNFIYGAVVDMIKFVFWGYHFPVFNIADMAIFFGVTLLVFEKRLLEKTQDA